VSEFGLEQESLKFPSVVDDLMYPAADDQVSCEAVLRDANDEVEFADHTQEAASASEIDNEEQPGVSGPASSGL
jgi:hypothetical protein